MGSRFKRDDPQMSCVMKSKLFSLVFIAILISISIFPFRDKVLIERNGISKFMQDRFGIIQQPKNYDNFPMYAVLQKLQSFYQKMLSDRIE